MKRGQRFPKERRIRQRAEFQQIYARRISVADQWIIVYAMPQDFPYPRLGLSISRKVGQAVVRNRWKRLIREAFRRTQDRLPAGVDLVVLARPVSPPSLIDLEKSLVQIAQRLARRLQRGT